MKHFYFVADYTAKYYLDVDNILISVGSGWNNGKWHNWGLKNVKRLFVDSGGYSFFSKWGDYPFTVQTYVERIYDLAEDNNLVACATRDYPCEQNINRSIIHTNKDRIQATVLGAIACITEDPDLPWIPVIQGYTLDEYKMCFNLYENSGIDTSDFDYWAIGSVCARKGNLHTIRKILTELSEYTNIRLHAFGLSLTYLRDPLINNAIYSSDSAAWNWGISKHEDKKGAVERYLKKVKMLTKTDNQQLLSLEREE